MSVTHFGASFISQEWLKILELSNFVDRYIKSYERDDTSLPKKT